jgi:hypothetical protein
MLTRTSLARVTALRRGPRLSLGVEVALAFGAGAASFALAAVTVVAVGSDVWFGVLGVVYGVAVVAMFRYFVTLKLARRALEDDSRGAPVLVAEALQHAEEATAELRELAHGILPSVLTRGGLRAGVGALASRMPVPVEIGISVERLPSAVEATAYFIVAEALTNVAKHSHANHAAVTARVEDGTLQVQVRDDGIGGAQPDGSGLLGLGDRLRARRQPAGGEPGRGWHVDRGRDPLPLARRLPLADRGDEQAQLE